MSIKYLEKELLSFCPNSLTDALVQQNDKDLAAGNSWRNEFVVAIIDISGFSSLANEWKESPEILAETINLIFSTLTTFIDSNDGDVINFAGDAVICAWNCESDEQSLERTVKKAVKAIQAIHENIQNSSTVFLKVHTGIGLESGNLIWVGSGQTYQFFVTGKVLENASVGLSLAKPGEIVFCPIFSSVYEAKGSGDTSSRLAEVADSGGYCFLKSSKTSGEKEQDPKPPPEEVSRTTSSSKRAFKRSQSKSIIVKHQNAEFQPSERQVSFINKVENQEDWDNLIEKPGPPIRRESISCGRRKYQ
ncbi:hypothetical protein TrVE_jg8130 [Triparma verrucosa]|uniref:Guanylate cyclase domain-containing protein n=1 Tax=Triparma verrucosa TaxID=1606542 RepID=A0A9W7F0I4_9STRA|nr:hypothetical protein TrVE_jg8130 [Triparma verrucosa]